MSDFKMPSLGADMDEGTVLEWKVAPGDKVRKGDVILEVDTDKAAFDVEADRDGTVEEILVEPGTKVPVGTVIARLSGDGEEASKPTAPPPQKTPKPAAETAKPAVPRGEHQRVSPLARVVAKDLGVDLSSIKKGTGIDGSIVKRDVEAAAKTKPAAKSEKPKPAEAPVPKSKREGLRQAIAAAMSRSKREIPHYYLSHTIDMEAALNWLEQENAKRKITERVLPNVLLLKAVAQALWDVPELNGYWENDALRQVEEVNLGVAISLKGGGVIAPAIHDADDKTLDQLMTDLADLVQRARVGTLKPSEMTDGTITVTSLGDRGTEAVYGVIFPPQVALVGFGAISERPWVVGGKVVPRRLVTATLSADHRATDGHRGGMFLRAIADRLQEPEKL